MQALAVSPFDPQNVIFGTMGGGLFITNNGGDSWASANNGYIGTGALGFTEDPANQNHLLMSASVGLSGNTGGFYETFNGGTVWNRVTSLPVDAVSLSISPASPSTLLAATWKSGIYQSTNGTAGPWSQVLGRPDLTLARFVRDEMNSNKVYAIASPVRFDTQTNDADLGIYFSADDGASWSQRPDFDGYYVAAHPANEGEAIAVGTDVYATTDSFASASVSMGLAAFAPGKAFLSAAFDPANPLTVVVGTITGEIYVTNNYNPAGTGVTWVERTNPATDVFIRNIVINADGWFVACWMGDMFSTPNSTEGILYSGDKGAPWTFLENNIGQGRLVYELFPSPTNPKRYHVGMWGSGLLRLSITQ